MGFSRQEYWNGLPFPFPGVFLSQGLNPGLPDCRKSLYCLSHQGSPYNVRWGSKPKISWMVDSQKKERESRALTLTSSSRWGQTAASKNSRIILSKLKTKQCMDFRGNCAPVRNTQGHGWWPLKLLFFCSYITKVLNKESFLPDQVYSWLGFLFRIQSSLGDSFSPWNSDWQWGSEQKNPWEGRCRTGAWQSWDVIT